MARTKLELPTATSDSAAYLGLETRTRDKVRTLMSINALLIEDDSDLAEAIADYMELLGKLRV